MKYTDLQGNPVSGQVWSPGPAARTVWVKSPLGQMVVVNATTRKQVDYINPEAPVAIPGELVQAAKGAMREVQPVLDVFRAGGLNVTPIEPRFAAAGAILRANDLNEKRRVPFINAHGGNQATSDKKLKELAAEEDSE